MRRFPIPRQRIVETVDELLLKEAVSGSSIVLQFLQDMKEELEEEPDYVPGEDWVDLEQVFDYLELNGFTGAARTDAVEEAMPYLDYKEIPHSSGGGLTAQMVRLKPSLSVKTF